MTSEAQQAACVGKHPYPTKLTALKVSRRQKYGGTQVFRCPYCSKWHIGHVDSLR
jgi:hypothetical protein